MVLEIGELDRNWDSADVHTPNPSCCKWRTIDVQGFFQTPAAIDRGYVRRRRRYRRHQLFGARDALRNDASKSFLKELSHASEIAVFSFSSSGQGSRMMASLPFETGSRGSQLADVDGKVLG